MAQGDIIRKATVASLVRTSPVRPTSGIALALQAAVEKKEA
jgi:hypothetical protein